ncbi:hypothetical protein [Phage NBSal001]|nr:hypothetical protein [Phage NBSal001]
MLNGKQEDFKNENRKRRILQRCAMASNGSSIYEQKMP